MASLLVFLTLLIPAWVAGADTLPVGCVLPASFVTTPGYVPIYADRDKGGAFSQIDPDAYARMKRIMDGFWRSSDVFIKQSDAVAHNSDPVKIRCALASLSKWAADGHMLGEPAGTPAENYQSIYETKWALQGYATAYALLLKKSASLEERTQIESWLKKVAARIARHQIDRYGSSNHNNHYYWAGASVMSVALASGDRGLFNLARKTFQTGIDQIGDDGVMPREAARKQQALHYHAYSLVPLVLMAEMAHMTGEDWYTYRPDRLPRLVALVLRGMQEPAFAEQKFGFVQDTTLMNECSTDRAWTYFVPDRFPQLAVPDHFSPRPGSCVSRWLGGDIAYLKAAGYFSQGIMLDEQ